jgi:hypothetical protein
MANSWGELSWSIGTWGLQNDSLAQLTGFQLNTTLNSVSVNGEINEGWGRLTWGENA